MAAATFSNSLGTFLLPFLPLYLDRVGIGAGRIGSAVSCYGVGCLVACFVGGPLSDRIGRKEVVLLNLAVSGAATASMILVKDHLAVLAILAVVGFCSGLSRPGVNALVADITEGDERVHAYGLLYWAGNLGFLCASLSGGVIASRSFATLFGLDAATCLAAFLIVLLGLGRTPPGGVRGEDGHEPGRSSTRMLLLVTAACLIAWTVQTQAWAALPLTVTAHGLSAVDWGILSATNGATVVLAQPLVNGLIDRWGLIRGLSSGVLVMGVGLALTPLFYSLTGYVLQTAGWSIGEALVATSAPALVGRYSSPSGRGTWMGYLAAAFALAGVVGPALGGAVLENGFSVELWSSCAVLGVVVSAVVIAARRRES